MLKNLKQTIKDSFRDEFKRHHLLEQVQLLVVAIFWVGLFAGLMIYSAKHPSTMDTNQSMPRASMKW